MGASGHTIVIVGGGAAGCFCAVEAKRCYPDAEVIVLESGPRPMVKLSLTGGGRCNITNTFNAVSDPAEVYPRGGRLMKRLFHSFGPEDAFRWWENEGVALFARDDERVFPKSQDALQVVGTLERLMKELGIKVLCNSKVATVRKDHGFVVHTVTGESYPCAAVVLTAGGLSDQVLARMLPEGVSVISTVPSLFTFRISDESLRSLMGLSVPEAALCIPGTQFRSSGALLLTDWGVSGPAVLRMSSYAARYLSAEQYRTPLLVNWTGMSESEIRSCMEVVSRRNPARMIGNAPVAAIPERLWRYLVQKAGIGPEQRWAELGSKSINRLVSVLSGTELQVTGRAAFKEEFVTCGGVSLEGVNPNTLESKACPGLFFAGEVLDIDALTGGFNLQAAWTTAFVAAHSLL